MTSHKADNLDLGFGIPNDALDYLDPEILKKWPQGLSDMLTVVENAHIRAGDDQKVARRRAFAAVRAISSFAGGRSLYVPQGRQLDRALRDREIWERHTGDNIQQLVADYGISEAQVYSILAEQRKLARARLQSDLFAEHDKG
ncbi:Transcriptional regulator, Middle operon regulator (Mor) family [Vreelandella subterranea]|uniref:Transcriptional regulator, Middle operon regulator (Mor) family n=1 Tax=Vreelandella subterranea TaxID=416874 RepID=A0A1H9V0I5_9GAMM|nr:Mor transcription activator family protein [Halomonas subterranea]SES15186.1 Transcriptional regulator, Middle operon regulator (Mor) family [Halomonas subterranea]